MGGSCLITLWGAVVISGSGPDDKQTMLLVTIVIVGVNGIMLALGLQLISAVVGPALYKYLADMRSQVVASLAFSLKVEEKQERRKQAISTYQKQAVHRVDDAAVASTALMSESAVE